MPATPAESLQTAERRAKVVELAAEGKTFGEIGEALGVSKQRAHQIFRAACAAIVTPAVEALRAQHLAETAKAREVALAGMDRDYVAHSQGRVVVDPETGEKLEDYGPKLDAARTLMAVQAREAKLVGADAPQRVEAQVTEHIDASTLEVRQLIDAQRARNLAARAELEGGEVTSHSGDQPA